MPINLSFPAPRCLRVLLVACALALGSLAHAADVPFNTENIQVETAWVDSGANPLSLRQYYSNFGALDTQMGPGWSHPWAATVRLMQGSGSLPLPQDAATAIVYLGDGHKQIFMKAAGAGSLWNPTSGVDQLEGSADAGWLYTRASDESRWSIDAQGQLQTITLRNGWTYTLSYDSQNRLVSVTNAFDRSLGFAYNGAGHLAAVTAPDGSQIVYGYDAMGRLIQAGPASLPARIYAYEDPSLPFALTGIMDESGTLTQTFSYKTQGQLAGITRAAVGSYTISYTPGASVGAKGYLAAIGTNNPDWHGITVYITYPNGRVETRQYRRTNSGVRMVAQTSPFSGSIAAFANLGGDQLIASRTDFRGTTTQYQWDVPRQLIVSVVRAANRAGESQTVQIDWHPSFRLPVKITETGAQGGLRVTEYSYDERGNLLSQTVSGTGLPARTRTWAYTAQNRVASAKDESGATTSYSYDAWGNRTAATDPTGRTTTYTHDAAGHVTSVTDPTGLLTSYSYDVQGRLLTASAAGLATAMSYLPTGLLASITQPGGYKVSYSYDAAQRLTGWSDNRGNSGAYALDGLNNLTHGQVKDAAGQTAFALSRTINAINRVASETVGGSQSASYSYDPNGDLVSVTNGLNQTSSYTLDSLRRLIVQQNPQNAQASLSYNALDGVIAAQDFKGVATQYTRDAQGNATQESSPDIGSQQASYDARGLNASSQDATGRSQQIERDALGRPTQINASAGAASLSSTLSYEPASGQLSQIQEPQLSTGYQRDALGRITRKSQTIGGSQP